MKKITRTVVGLVLALTVVFTPVVVSASSIALEKPPVTITPFGWIAGYGG